LAQAVRAAHPGRADALVRVMEVTEHNDVKVYSLSAGKSVPQWLEEAKKTNKSLRYNEDFRRRIDLIQDFEFRIASNRVRVSPDGEFVAAVGVYPPEVRLFETRELGMKCARGLDSEVVDFQFLGEGYQKLAFLTQDRTIEFHSQYGRHHRVRVPKAGRSLCYDPEGCSIFCAGSSAEVVRLDLEVGGFQAPIALRRLGEVNCLAINPVLPVLSCAGDGGLVESFDLRDPSRALTSLPVGLPQDGAAGAGAAATCCAYSSSGMQFAAGTGAGVVRVYDVRSSRHLAERDHMNGYPVNTVSFQDAAAPAPGGGDGGGSAGRLLVGSSDSKSVKVWDANTGALAASVESPATINHFTFYPRSGLIFVANDQQRMGVFFIPSLGLAPQWCSFLDSITEELEESTQKVIFDNYQFVTSDQLEQLGASDLVGTKFLQPYMHGFFMDQRLHARLKAAMDPFAYSEYRKQKVQQKLEAKRTMRTLVKRKVGVNPQLHELLQESVGEGELEGASKKRKDAAKKAKSLLADERFQVLFADPDFAIQEKGPEAEVAAPAPLPAKRKKAAKRGAA